MLVFDFVFEKDNFRMQWNLSDDGMLWLLKDSSLNEIGCIHTCQGLELDYPGVIIGEDMIAAGSEEVTDVTKRVSPRLQGAWLEEKNEGRFCRH